MLKYYKIHLLPTDEQKELFYKSFNAARYAYNWALNEQINYIKKYNTSKHKFQLRRDFTLLKNIEANFTLEVSSKVTSEVIIELSEIIETRLAQNKPLPHFKSVHTAKKIFIHRADKIYFTQTAVKLEKIGWVELGEHNRISQYSTYINPRISYDGFHFYLTVGCKIPDNTAPIPKNNNPIGIDLGITTLMTCSDGTTYNRLSMTKEFKKLKRLQRKATKQYKYMQDNKITKKSKNLIKLEKEITTLFRRIKNKRLNNIHHLTSTIIKKRPTEIILDTLKSQPLLQTKRLAPAVLDCSFHTIQNQLKYKAENHNIPLKIADKYYASSKICNACKKQISHIKVTTRIFTCPYCNFTLDRDLNAALNLKSLATQIPNQSIKKPIPKQPQSSPPKQPKPYHRKAQHNLPQSILKDLEKHIPF